MRLPRDVSGDDLARRLARLGYVLTRQAGSHMRLTLVGDQEHHVTIPKHKDLRVGTLHSILADVAQHLNITLDELLRRLWT